MAFDEEKSHVLLEVSDGLREVLPKVIRRVRAMLDLDADPKAINAVLHERFPRGDGMFSECSHRRRLRRSAVNHAEKCPARPRAPCRQAP